MALKLLQSGIQPLGQFDGYDTQYLTLKGGEVMQFGFAMAPNPPGVDKATSDVFADGYADNGNKRTVVALAGSAVAGAGAPYMLADEGVFGYGTLFGSVVGGIAGQAGISAWGVATAAPLGPSTASGSGKVTCWDKPGLYAVSLDAVDSSLQPDQALVPGDAVEFVAGTGLLCASGAGAGVQVATFVSFETMGSLVTTPSYLVEALNSPSGSPAAAGKFSYVAVHFNPYGT